MGPGTQGAEPKPEQQRAAGAAGAAESSSSSQSSQSQIYHSRVSLRYFLKNEYWIRWKARDDEIMGVLTGVVSVRLWLFWSACGYFLKYDEKKSKDLFRPISPL